MSLSKVSPLIAIALIGRKKHASLYVAVISDEFEKETYQTMHLDPMSVPVEIQLGGLEKCAGQKWPVECITSVRLRLG